MTRQTGLMCLAFAMVSIALPEDSDAQLRIFDQVVQRPFRALGHGTGPGYHRCNPGPDTGYYNPWSQKNSFLISQSPEFLSRFGHEDRSPMSMLRSGQSAYTMNNAAFGTGYTGNSVPLNADFVPTAQNKSDFNQPPADIPTDEKPESSLPAANKNVEDAFEKEADKIDENSDEEVGGFKSLKEGIEVSPVELPSVFLPASHSK